MTKPTKWHVHPAKTQISLGICPVWSESSLRAQWVAMEPMRRLIRMGGCPGSSVFPGCTYHFVGFVMHWLKCHSQSIVHSEKQTGSHKNCLPYQTWQKVYQVYSVLLTYKDWRPLNREMANSADPDQTPQNLASDKGLHCLETVQPFFFII